MYEFTRVGFRLLRELLLPPRHAGLEFTPPFQSDLVATEIEGLPRNRRRGEQRVTRRTEVPPE